MACFLGVLLDNELIMDLIIWAEVLRTTDMPSPPHTSIYIVECATVLEALVMILRVISLSSTTQAAPCSSPTPTGDISQSTDYKLICQGPSSNDLPEPP